MKSEIRIDRRGRRVSRVRGVREEQGEGVGREEGASAPAVRRTS